MDNAEEEGLRLYLTTRNNKSRLIDIGKNQITHEDGRVEIVRDVDTDGVKEIASWVTPVPVSVDPVTVTILIQNTMTVLRNKLLGMARLITQ